VRLSLTLTLCEQPDKYHRPNLSFNRVFSSALLLSFHLGISQQFSRRQPVIIMILKQQKAKTKSKAQIKQSKIIK
jgi:hypothetical protein